MPFETSIKYLNAGLFSEFLRARDEYKASCKQLKNFIPTLQGPLVRRGGTIFHADITGAIRLVPFIFNAEQRYLFVFFPTRIDILNGGTYTLHSSINVSYAEDDIPNLYISQVQDVMYIAHANYPLKSITRSAGSGGVISFALSDVVFQNGPYMEENTTNTTFTFASNKITSSTDIFDATDVGRWIHVEVINSGTTKVFDCQITSYIDANNVNVGNVDGDTDGTATKLWRMSPFSSKIGYPEAICLHQERIWVAKGGYVYAGKQSAGTDFKIKKKDGVVDDQNGFSCNLSNERSGDIFWLISSDLIYVGGLNCINGVTSNSFGYAVTPSNRKAVKAQMNGACSSRPVLVDDGVVFIDLFRRSMYFLKYNSVYDNYSNDNLMTFNEDVSLGKIKEVCYSSKRIPCLWCCKKDGSLIGCSFSTINKIVAWFEADVGGFVQSITSLPNISEEKDDVLLAVKRNINGEEKLYLEEFSAGLDPGIKDARGAVFLDCCSGVINDDVAFDEVDNLEHLEGKTVSVLLDGAKHPDCVVSDGKIKLNTKGKSCVVGLPFESVIEPATIVPIEGAERKHKHISGIELMLLDSLGGMVGVNDSNMKWMPMRYTNYKMDQANNLFSGNYKVASGGYWTQDASVIIKTSDPLPFTLLGIYVTMEIEK